MTTLYSSSGILVSIFGVTTLGMSAVYAIPADPRHVCFPHHTTAPVTVRPGRQDCHKNWLSRGRLCGSGTLGEWQRGMITT